MQRESAFKLNQEYNDAVLAARYNQRQAMKTLHL